MTEAEWMACTDPQVLLDSLYPFDRVSQRKLRLFVCACCRCAWSLFQDTRSRRAVEVAEAYADGLATEEEIDQARLAAESALDEAGGEPEFAPGAWLGAWAADREVEEMVNATAQAEMPSQREKCLLLHDIFDFLAFGPVPIDPAWLTPTVTALAGAIYKERAYDRLPILADALEDAGCTNVEVLNHCRQQGVHVRGCWAVDLLLNKE